MNEEQIAGNPEKIVVTVKQLREYCDVVFDYLERSGQDPIVIEHDYYMYLTNEQMLGVGEKNVVCKTAGQVSDDINRLDEVVRNPSDVIGGSLVWVSDLLRNASMNLL